MNMKAAYLIWDVLLQTIAAKERLFYSTLTESLLNGITQDSDDTADGFRKRALLQWLLHLLTSTSWQKSQYSSDELRSTIMERCITHPDSWSKSLARAVLDGSDNNFQEQWEPYFETSFLDVESEGEAEDEAPPPRSRQSNNFDKPTKTFDHKPNNRSLDTSTEPRKNWKVPSKIKSKAPSLRESSGWKLWEGGWLPKPIGFPHLHQ